MNKAPLKRAIEAAGSQSALARVLGVAQGHVAFWLHKSNKGVPAEYCIPIEEATGVSRYELRPDVFGNGEAA